MRIPSRVFIAEGVKTFVKQTSSFNENTLESFHCRRSEDFCKNKHLVLMRMPSRVFITEGVETFVKQISSFNENILESFHYRRGGFIRGRLLYN
jgi:hypothetical protein